MNQLQTANVKTLTSIEVAEMVGKEHKNLLADIRGYIEDLGGLKVKLTDFFEKNTYRSSQNKELPCYNITKKGCELIANKLAGKKGTQFTVMYVTKFNDMEQSGFKYDNLSPQLQVLIGIETQQSAQAKRLDVLEKRVNGRIYALEYGGYGKLKKLLDEHDMTAYALAQAIGLSRTVLGNWKNGKRMPSVNSMQKIANYFNKPIDYFTK